MNRELHISIFVIVMLTTIISGCDATLGEPTKEPHESVQIATAVIATAVVDAPEETSTAPVPVEKTRAPVPEPSSTPIIVDPYPGWLSYSNETYEFTFRYPAAWTLKEESSLLMLSRGTLLFAVAFQRQGEDVPSPWTGMPAGDIESRGTIMFLEQEIDKQALVYEGKVKGLSYGAEVDDLLFFIRLDDVAQVDYGAIEISKSTQDEIDQIVGSFARG